MFNFLKKKIKFFIISHYYKFPNAAAELQFLGLDELITEILLWKRKSLTKLDILVIFYIILFIQLPFFLFQLTSLLFNCIIGLIKLIPGTFFYYKICTFFSVKILPILTVYTSFLYFDLLLNKFLFLCLILLLLLWFFLIYEFIEYWVQCYINIDLVSTQTTIMDDLVGELLTLPFIFDFMKKQRFYQNFNLIEDIFFLQVPRNLPSFHWHDLDDEDMTMHRLQVETVIADKILNKTRQGTIYSAVNLFILEFYFTGLFCIFLCLWISPAFIFGVFFISWCILIDYSLNFYLYYEDISSFIEYEYRLQRFQKNRIIFFEPKLETLFSQKRLLKDILDYYDEQHLNIIKTKSTKNFVFYLENDSKYQQEFFDLFYKNCIKWEKKGEKWEDFFSIKPEFLQQNSKKIQGFNKLKFNFNLLNQTIKQKKEQLQSYYKWRNDYFQNTSVQQLTNIQQMPIQKFVLNFSSFFKYAHYYDFRYFFNTVDFAESLGEREPYLQQLIEEQIAENPEFYRIHYDIVVKVKTEPYPFLTLQQKEIVIYNIIAKFLSKNFHYYIKYFIPSIFSFRFQEIIKPNILSYLLVICFLPFAGLLFISKKLYYLICPRILDYSENANFQKLLEFFTLINTFLQQKLIWSYNFFKKYYFMLTFESLYLFFYKLLFGENNQQYYIENNKLKELLTSYFNSNAYINAQQYKDVYADVDVEIDEEEEEAKYDFEEFMIDVDTDPRDSLVEMYDLFLNYFILSIFTLITSFFSCIVIFFYLPIDIISLFVKNIFNFNDGFDSFIVIFYLLSHETMFRDLYRSEFVLFENRAGTNLFLKKLLNSRGKEEVLYPRTCQFQYVYHLDPYLLKKKISNDFADFYDHTEEDLIRNYGQQEFLPVINNKELVWDELMEKFSNLEPIMPVTNFLRLDEDYTARRKTNRQYYDKYIYLDQWRVFFKYIFHYFFFELIIYPIQNHIFNFFVFLKMFIINCYIFLASFIIKLLLFLLNLKNSVIFTKLLSVKLVDLMFFKKLFLFLQNFCIQLSTNFFITKLKLVILWCVSYFKMISFIIVLTRIFFLFLVFTIGYFIEWFYLEKIIILYYIKFYLLHCLLIYLFCLFFFWFIGFLLYFFYNYKLKKNKRL